MEPHFKVKVDSERDDYGKFVIEPLEQGYGDTLGNSLRRVLLSSLPGAAVTVVKIEGVQHQFSTITGLKEDMVEFILNVKKIRLSITGVDEEVTLKLAKHGPGEIRAEDIKVPAGVTVVNPDQYLGTLADRKAKIEAQFIAKAGYGYETASEKQIDTIGYIPVDSAYTPVLRVNYKVEATRVGRMTNLDKLIIEIWTDKTIAPRSALQEAAKILVSYFAQLYNPQTEEEETLTNVPVRAKDDVMMLRIEELDIPTRIVNALENGGIMTVEQLLTADKKDVMKIRNLGMKSLNIIEKKLSEKGVTLNLS